MKKAAILKIPYLRPKKMADGYSHIAVSFIENIAGKDHLIIDVYINKKEELAEPIARLAYTKDDWSIYWPDSKAWTGGGYGNGVCKAWEHMPKDRTYVDKKYVALILGFCKDIRVYSSSPTWTEKLTGLENHIRRMRACKTSERHAARLNERIANTPKLPDDINEWAEKRLFDTSHYIYYKRKGKYFTVACSACGNVAEKKISGMEDMYEDSSFTVYAPKNNERGVCPACKAIGTYKAAGRAKCAYGTTKYFYVAQPYKKEGAVIRYIHAEKSYHLEYDNKGMPTWASENTSIIETARMYIERGKRPQTDYHKNNCYTGEAFWDYCNMGGFYNIRTGAGYIYEKSYELLKGTILQYSGAEAYGAYNERYNMPAYMSAYILNPQLEMMVKMKLFGIAEKMINSEYGFVADEGAANPADYLGIYKARLSYLKRSKGDVKFLQVLQQERREGASWTDREINFLSMVNPDMAKLRLATSHMSLTQFINRVEKYAGYDITKENALCGRAYPYIFSHIRHTTDTYLDYLMMRSARGYDISNTVYLFPRDLEAAHQEMVAEVNKEQADKRIREAEALFPGIRKNYRKLRSKYFYEDDTYIIRPARSAEEIVMEGRKLHHCVGGNSYLEKHNTNKSHILMLRFRKKPKEPYITVEIENDGSIKQWYGAHDKKPDEKNMQKWLDAYVLRLKSNGRDGSLEISVQIRTTA